MANTQVIIKHNGVTTLKTAGKYCDKDIDVLANMGYIEDLPTTPGQWACLARASQMRDITYTPKADMLNAYETMYKMTAGTEYNGIIYSSVRALDWFIGYTISMYSYLTALNNPKSVIYTKKYKDYFSLSAEEDPDDRANAIVYNVYGTNCSSYVSYCLDRPYLGTTGTLPLLPNIIRLCEGTERMTDFDALRNELQLCDLAGGIIEHIEIVTGIRRDKNGVIQEVDLSDSWPPRIRKITYTWDEFVKHCGVDYNYPFLRYTDLDQVTFPENLSNIVYSDIVTNRGDKVCIRPDMDIALNVLGSGYAGIVLFKDGMQVSTQSSTDDWELTNLTTGKYTAILYKNGETVTIDDANETNSTSFIVCAVSISRKENTYSYTADAVGGVYPKPMQVTLKDKFGFTIKAGYIEDDAFAGSGSIDVTSSQVPVIIHCPFKTEYGFVIAECGYAETPLEPEDVNLVPTAIGTDGKIYNGTGYKDGYRFKSSDPINDIEQPGSVTTGYIPCAVGDKFEVSGVEWGKNTAIGFYTASAVYRTDYIAIPNGSISGDGEYCSYLRRNTALETGNGYVFEVLSGGGAETPAWIRFSMKGNGADMVVTKIK